MIQFSNEDPPQKFYLFSAAIALTTLFIGWLVGGGAVAWCVLLAFGVQWLSFLPAAASQNERAFDLVGAATFLVVMAYSLSQGPGGPRQILVTGMVTVWALRLGVFLFWRVHQRGGDRRFDQIKVYPARFFSVWSLQGLWVSVTALAAMTINSNTPATALGLLDYIGVGAWVIGFGVEAISDWQKTRFNMNPHNNGRFIQSGFWAFSQHPNYFGEILLWSGIALIGVGVFTGTQWLAVLSPVFVAVLLTQVSGIPLLDAAADKKWGADPAYQRYKQKVSALIPMPDPDSGAYVRAQPATGAHAEAH